MLVKEVKELAESKGVKVGKMKKLEIVRAIQVAEGNTACFQTDFAPSCQEMGCLWREDCLSGK